jgi:hypothetical protein
LDRLSLSFYFRGADSESTSKKGEPNERSIDDYSLVVITSEAYDHDTLLFGTRLYWQLKHYGHDRLAMLDGGNAQWRKAGRPISYEASQAQQGNFTTSAERTELLATTDVAIQGRQRASRPKRSVANRVDAKAARCRLQATASQRPCRKRLVHLEGIETGLATGYQRRGEERCIRCGTQRPPVALVVGACVPVRVRNRTSANP